MSTLSISRERVRQILVRNKVRTAALREQKVPALCRVCGLPLKRGTTQGLKGQRASIHKTCHTDFVLTFICSVCGKPFQLKNSVFKARMKHRKVHQIFCSNTCWGSYAGSHYGVRMSAHG